MNKSESTKNLFAALCKVQAALRPASKDKENPFFKSKYATLESTWEAARPHLTENGLCVVQTTDLGEHGMELVTTLGHSSGEWIEGRYLIVSAKNDPQSIGSAVTYARRYSLSAIIGGTSEEDDDGEGAVSRDEAQGKVASVTQLVSGGAQIQGEKFPFENENKSATGNLGSCTFPAGKNKGKTFDVAGIAAVQASLKAAGSGIADNAEWVQKVGVERMKKFVEEAKSYLKAQGV